MTDCENLEFARGEIIIPPHSKLLLPHQGQIMRSERALDGGE